MLICFVTVESVLQQQQQDVFDEIEIIAFLCVTIESEIFANCKDEHVQRCEIGAIRTIWIGAVLKENANAIQVTNLWKILMRLLFGAVV